MGWLQNIKTVKAWAEEAYESAPRWGRILRIGPRVGPFTRILLEVHYGYEPPCEASTLSWVPRGVKPQVGQDVAIRISSGDGDTTYPIVWDRPPHYGTPLDETVDPVERLARAVGDGRASEADIERVKRKLDALRPPQG